MIINAIITTTTTNEKGDELLANTKTDSESREEKSMSSDVVLPLLGTLS